MPSDVHADLADQLRRLLDAISAGDLAASAATQHRIEGAVVALDILAGKDPHELVSRLLYPMPEDLSDTKRPFGID